MRQLLAAAILCIFVAPAPAVGEWKPEYAQLPQAVQDWYKNAELTPEAQKRFSYKSCCAHSDVVRTRFRVNKVDGADEWMWLDGAEWRVIPADVIHVGEHAPDGQPTLFVIGQQPVCFYPGDGGI